MLESSFSEKKKPTKVISGLVVMDEILDSFATGISGQRWKGLGEGVGYVRKWGEYSLMLSSSKFVNGQVPSALSQDFHVQMSRDIVNLTRLPSFHLKHEKLNLTVKNMLALPISNNPLPSAVKKHCIAPVKRASGWVDVREFEGVPAQVLPEEPALKRPDLRLT